MSDLNLDPSTINNGESSSHAGPSTVQPRSTSGGVKRRSSGKVSTGQTNDAPQASTSRIGVGRSGTQSQASSADQNQLTASTGSGDGSRKRQRRQSPKKASRSSLPTASTDISSDSKGKGKADAPFIQAGLIARGVRPYPIGLTPFRYQCHHPDVPPPPPGDPNDPKFRRFDPTAPVAPADSLPKPVNTNPTDPQPQPPPQARQPQANIARTNAGDTAGESVEETFAGIDTGQTDGDVYESLSALLSASDFQNHLAELEAQGAFAHTELELGDGQEET